MVAWWKRFKQALSLQRWPVLTPEEADKAELDRQRKFLLHLYNLDT